MDKNLFVIVDGNALVHRAYHAYPLNLKTSKGELVNAVYGFTRLLLKLATDLSPRFLAIAFDRPEPTFRHLEYVGYKAHRPKMDQELAGQLERLRQLVDAYGIRYFEMAGFEADDVIGTLAVLAKEIDRGLNICIITGDMDALQLVDDRTYVLVPVKGLSSTKLWGVAQIKEHYGFGPKEIVDFKALRGDPSDDIPGVKGIGEKTAKNLIKKCCEL